MNRGQLNMRNRELQLSFLWRNNYQEGPKSPMPIRVSLSWGKAPLLLQLLPAPQISSSSCSLENRTVFLNIFFRLSWSHSPAFWLLLGCNHISASSSPAWPRSHRTPCGTQANEFGFLYPRTCCPCAAEVKHSVILLASKAMCMS